MKRQESICNEWWLFLPRGKEGDGEAKQGNRGTVGRGDTAMSHSWTKEVPHSDR